MHPQLCGFNMHPHHSPSPSPWPTCTHTKTTGYSGSARCIVNDYFLLAPARQQVCMYLFLYEQLWSIFQLRATRFDWRGDVSLFVYSVRPAFLDCSGVENWSDRVNERRSYYAVTVLRSKLLAFDAWHECGRSMNRNVNNNNNNNNRWKLTFSLANSSSCSRLSAFASSSVVPTSIRSGSICCMRTRIQSWLWNIQQAKFSSRPCVVYYIYIYQ